jgi:hypothetical protein
MNLEKKEKLTQPPPLMSSLLPHPHIAFPCDTWRAGIPLLIDFLAPQRVTCHVRGKLISLRESRLFSNDFDIIYIVERKNYVITKYISFLT